MIDSFRGGHAAIEEKRILLDASLDLTSQDDKRLKKKKFKSAQCHAIVYLLWVYNVFTSYRFLSQFHACVKFLIIRRTLLRII